jgi:hypothetical protein
MLLPLPEAANGVKNFIQMFNLHDVFIPVLHFHTHFPLYVTLRERLP